MNLIQYGHSYGEVQLNIIMQQRQIGGSSLILQSSGLSEHLQTLGNISKDKLGEAGGN